MSEDFKLLCIGLCLMLFLVGLFASFFSTRIDMRMRVALRK